MIEMGGISALVRQHDYSLDVSSSRVVSSETRQVFQEALECYLNGAYRLSIVGLWTTIVFDLLIKVTEMVDLYGDETAKKLLTEVETDRKNSEQAKSPKWELKLLKNVKERTEILDEMEYQNLLQIYNLRNLCAHPLLSRSSPGLLEVRQDKARSCFVDALEGVLTKHSLLTGKISNRILSDLTTKNFSGQTTEEFERFYTARYIDYMSESAKVQLFRSLWKLAFRVPDEDAESVRGQLVQLVRMLYEKNSNQYLDIIKTDPSFFGSTSSEGTCLRELHFFLASHHGVYEALPPSTQAEVREFVLRPNSDLAVTSSYLDKELYDFFGRIQRDIKSGKLEGPSLKLLPKLKRGSPEMKLLCNLLIEGWRDSHSYKVTISLCSLVEFLFNDFETSHLVELYKIAESNQNIYKCFVAKDTLKRLIEKLRVCSPETLSDAVFGNLDSCLD